MISKQPDIFIPKTSYKIPRRSYRSSHLPNVAGADLDKSKCYHIQNRNGYCLQPYCEDAKPQPDLITERIGTTWGCDKDWQLFCPTSEGYIRHFTSGLCLHFKSWEKSIVLTEDCWPEEFEELPNKGGIMDVWFGGCLEPDDPLNPAKPRALTPITVNEKSNCEPKDVQFFFNRG